MRDFMAVPLTLWAFLVLALLAAVAYGVAWAVKWRAWRGVDPIADAARRTAERYARLGAEGLPTVEHGERDAAIRLRQAHGADAPTIARRKAETDDVRWARVAQLLETRQV